MPQSQSAAVTGCCRKVSLALFATVAVTTVPAFAGEPVGSITFSPGSAAAIPTLGNALLIMLAGLLVLIALKSYRHARGVTPSMIGLLTVAALAGTGGGINLVKTVEAGIPATPITQAQGQTLPLVDGINRFENDTDTTLRVSRVEFTANCAIEPTLVEEPDCTVGTTLQSGGLCLADVTCIEGNASDRRLKTDITQTGVADNGLPLYRFRYRNGTQYFEGVMAQDVLEHTPAAVVTNRDGYYFVRYDMLGISMRRVD